MISKTHLRDVTLGDVYEGMPEYLIRLYGDIYDCPVEGRTLSWVDFEVIEVTGYQSAKPPEPTTILRMGTPTDKGPKFFQRRDAIASPDPVYTPEEAEVAASGFVKWDGCTQMQLDPIHIDEKRQLTALFDAIHAARKLASEHFTNPLRGVEW